jgi:hypothetical protein
MLIALQGNEHGRGKIPFYRIRGRARIFLLRPSVVSSVAPQTFIGSKITCAREASRSSKPNRLCSCPFDHSQTCRTMMAALFAWQFVFARSMSGMFTILFDSVVHTDKCRVRAVSLSGSTEMRVFVWLVSNAYMFVSMFCC